MKLERFQKEKQKKKRIIGICSIVLLFTLVIVIKSFAVYEERQGKESNPNLAASFAYTMEDKEGNITNLEKTPEDKNYEVSIICDNGAEGVWDYESWGPLIKNLTTTRTKCKINFSPLKPSIEIAGKTISLVEEGSGLYMVNHADAEITYTSDETAIQNLKQTEYRYAGSDPNNYVNFNNELWRVIGLVNTPEGSRIKLIRNESIGDYSWDSSSSSINHGWGTNVWSQSKMMDLLNKGAYYNRNSGTCYNGINNATTECDFSESGLTEEAKDMIEAVTWNLGSNDGISRTTTWIGSVGLMYLSDYGYATSGGVTTDRTMCLNTELSSWRSISDCASNNWLYKSEVNQWSMTPYAHSSEATLVFSVGAVGSLDYNGVPDLHTTSPNIYLKTNVKIISGSGEENDPFQLDF